MWACSMDMASAASTEEVCNIIGLCPRNALIHVLGKSDPFAVFTLNGQRVFKSQTKKKTLTPEWFEDFVVSVVCASLL